MSTPMQAMEGGRLAPPVHSFTMVDDVVMRAAPTHGMARAVYALCRCAGRGYEVNSLTEDILAASADPESGGKPIGRATLCKTIRWMVERGHALRRLHDPRVLGGRRIILQWRRPEPVKEFGEARAKGAMGARKVIGGRAQSDRWARAKGAPSYEEGQSQTEGAPSAACGGEPPPPPARGDAPDPDTPPTSAAAPPSDREEEVTELRACLGGPMARAARARLVEMGEPVEPTPDGLPSDEDFRAKMLADHGVAPPPPRPRLSPGTIGDAGLPPPPRQMGRDEQLRLLAARKAAAPSSGPETPRVAAQDGPKARGKAGGGPTTKKPRRRPGEPSVTP